MNEPRFPIRIDVWIDFFPEGSNWNDLKLFNKKNKFKNELLAELTFN